MVFAAQSGAAAAGAQANGVSASVQALPAPQNRLKYALCFEGGRATALDAKVRARIRQEIVASLGEPVEARDLNEVDFRGRQGLDAVLVCRVEPALHFLEARARVEGGPEGLPIPEQKRIWTGFHETGWGRASKVQGGDAARFEGSLSLGLQVAVSVLDPTALRQLDGPIFRGDSAAEPFRTAAPHGLLKRESPLVALNHVGEDRGISEAAEGAFGKLAPAFCLGLRSYFQALDPAALRRALGMPGAR